MTISKSSGLSINALLIFEMQDLNGELFLNLFQLYHFHLQQQLKNLMSVLQQYMHHYSHLTIVMPILAT